MKIVFPEHAKRKLKEMNITSRQAIKIIKVPDFTSENNGRVEARRQVDGKIIALTYTIQGNEIKVASLEEKSSFY